MKPFILPVLALLIAAPSFAAETTVSLDIVKVERKKVVTHDKCDPFNTLFLSGRNEKVSTEGSVETYTGFDKDGLKRITFVDKVKCYENSFELKLYSKSGEAFKQDDDSINFDALIEKLKKSSDRCPLNIYVNGNGTYKKSAFDCKVFSEDESAPKEIHIESGEAINAPAT